VSGAPVAVPGFVDAHTHLLTDAGGVPLPRETSTVAAFHRRVAGEGSTPMDVPEPPPSADEPELAARLAAGLARAAATGLVEVTEMGMYAWWYLDVLERLELQAGGLPVRVRIYLASGLAERAGLAEMEARRSGTGNWVRLDGVKFYCDGWLGTRTCAMGWPFDDRDDDGLLFMDAGTLARRIEPLAGNGWRIATHAIGDRGVATVLDAYDLAWGGDAAAMFAAAPRIEHASVQSAEIIARIAESGVVACIQPSFAVTDAEQVRLALDPQRRGSAYPWAALAAAGARLLAGTDYPIEVIEPLVSLARLVLGSSARAGFATAGCAPEGSRLDLGTAVRLMTDAGAGQTLLSADPRSVPPGELDRIQVAGTAPVPFAIGH
jgi:predicted amidohydrolase YtcJ